MKIVSRYVRNEVVQHAAIGVALFTFVLFMRDLGKLLDLVVRDTAPLPSVVQIFLLTLPIAFTITIPIGLLVGILIGLSRLAADSEITAMRASGIGAWRFVRIVGVVAIATWVVALAISVWLSPASAAALGRLEGALRSSQASFEIQPRVFYEGFKNMVLYVEDIHSTAHAAEWRGVFLADVSNAGAPRITVARRGIILSDDPGSIQLHLDQGSQQEVAPDDPEQYQISTFSQTDLPISLPKATIAKGELAPVSEMSTAELWYRGHHPEANNGKPSGALATPEARARWYLVEFHRRLALPTSCLVLALVGIPLGIASKKGGKSLGFVLAIALVFLYYFLSLTGISLGRGGRVPPGVGVWAANFLFFFAGLFLLHRVEKTGIDFGGWRAEWQALRRRFKARRRARAMKAAARRHGRPVAEEDEEEVRRGARYPLLLDKMILRDFLRYLAMILISFLLLTLLFTFFELLGDIVRNRIPLLMVGQYMLHLSPSMVYAVAPLSVLLAVLTTFGLLQKTNQITAMMATGISVYRLLIPVFVIAGALSAALFAVDQLYIPTANQRQETLRNKIKGKPPQTYLRPDRKWIFGENKTIYYYEFFDPDANTFGNITVFHFDPESFELTERVHAARAHWSDELNKWIFERGWTRTFQGSEIESYRTFDVGTFPSLVEPPSYFKKEVRQSSEMSAHELRAYIADLHQSGFDVVRLRVQLEKKYSYPLITLVMSVLAVPFALSAGRRGATAGIAVAVSIAIFYLVAAGFFEALGNASQLPAAMAAWAPDILFGLFGGYLLLKVPT